VSADLATDTALRSRVEDFLYAEAALLDEWRLDDWLQLLSEDTRPMINARVTRLNSRKAHREFPWSRTRRIIGNVRVLAVETDGDLQVTANFAVYRTRSGRTHVYAGRYRYRLRPRGEAFQIAFRRAELDQENLDEHGTLSIIL
jgi:p-cumate 2,3-dioxygenase beta subunit